MCQKMVRKVKFSNHDFNCVFSCQPALNLKGVPLCMHVNKQIKTTPVTVIVLVSVTACNNYQHFAEHTGEKSFINPFVASEEAA